MNNNRADQIIDFIVYWVDGNDPVWRAKKNQYQDTTGVDVRDQRYRDWDNLRYLFRGIEKYTPWVNRVFFVSDQQIPEWMNVDCPKLRIIDHKDYIPQTYLPVFSSHGVELNFHRIDELSEQFVVFNDDFFLTNYVKPTDFFQNGKPVDIFMEYPVICSGKDYVISHIMSNLYNTIGKHYERTEYKRRLRSKILSPRYGVYFFYNLIMYMLPFPKFFGLLTPHFCRPYLKSTFFEVWQEEHEILDSTCKSRFRSQNDVSIYLFRLWDIMRGNFVPGNIFKMGHAFFVSDEDETVCRAIANGRYQMICINDACDEKVFETMKEKIKDSFQKRLPEKCTFER